MRFWLFKFDQPRGFNAMRLEIEGFTRVASHVRSSAEPGDRVVVYNIAERHVAAVLTVTERAYVRSHGDDLDRWPFAIGTQPELVSPRGPKWPLAGRNFRRLTENEFTELESLFRRNQG